MQRPVPFNDLRRQSAEVAEQLAAVARRVIESGWYLLGPETEQFESAFATFCDTSGCVSVANGTDALEIALRSVGCEPGDEIIMAANAGMYATVASLAIGAVPVFADVDARTLLLAPPQVSSMVSPRTRAVVATHLYGNVVDVELLRSALPDGVAIVEDCAQAHGASLRGRPVGSLGDIASFSFYPTKNLGALGDAGAVVSSQADLLAQARALRQYGWESRYNATVPGGRNSRMDELQAGFLHELLPLLIDQNARRTEIRDRYVADLGSQLEFVETCADGQPVVHLCVVRTQRRAALLSTLHDLGVECAVHFPTPDHRQPAIQGRPFRHDDLLETTRACDEVLSLPCFPALRDDEVDHVIASVREAA